MLYGKNIIFLIARGVQLDNKVNPQGWIDGPFYKDGYIWQAVGDFGSGMPHNSKAWVTATPHTRLRAPDRYTSSTLIGGKGGTGPSSLHTTLHGPIEYVNARWM